MTVHSMMFMDIRPEDARALVELANTVEDCSPEEVEALSRVQKALTEYERAASLAQEIDHEHLLGAETEERRGLERGESPDQEIASDDDKGDGIGD